MNDGSVRYVFNGSGANIYHTTKGPVFQVFQREKNEEPTGEVGANADPLTESERRDDQTIRSRTFSATFPGARQVKPVGHNELQTKINYCIGEKSQWHTGVSTYGTVAYEGLYEGIDLYTYGRRDHLKYEFHVTPRADWRTIRVHYNGITGLSINDDGSLTVNLGEDWGKLTDDAPYIYQEVDGRRLEVPGRFELIDDHTYAFDITGDYDPAQPLIIDPELAATTGKPM